MKDNRPLTREEFLNNLWRWKCGLSEDEFKPYITLEDANNNWSPEFERLMRNRMAFGTFRYGSILSQRTKVHNNIKSIKARIKLWEETGNDELLVDIANLCMVEFVTGKHPKKHFNSLSDHDAHVELL